MTQVSGDWSVSHVIDNTLLQTTLFIRHVITCSVSVYGVHIYFYGDVVKSELSRGLHRPLRIGALYLLQTYSTYYLLILL